ncbi:hypothetical protein HQ487_05265 [Candidatus Uhrbacteria bacterium]|nr:hypothetical protein [Candidatus Uhrbacteria bacterium]
MTTQRNAQLARWRTAREFDFAQRDSEDVSLGSLYAIFGMNTLKVEFTLKNGAVHEGADWELFQSHLTLDGHEINFQTRGVHG